MLWRIRFWFQDLIRQEEGQDLVENALVIVLIVIAAVASLQTVAGKIVAVFNAIAGDL
jgi:Flp pilus assembly pilin Flp